VRRSGSPLPLGLFFVVFVVMPLLLLGYVSLHNDTGADQHGLAQYRKFLGDRSTSRCWATRCGWA
jgi:putative spermidine/putrescine transport system permease protein